jgi:hypothetical protein
MHWFDAVCYMLLGAAAFIALQAVARRLIWARETQMLVAGEDTLPTIKPLADGLVREWLTKFLLSNRFLGDANIRNGLVHEVLPAKKLDAKVVELRRLVDRLHALKDNGEVIGTGLFYAQHGPSKLGLTDIDIVDLEYLVSIAERVAEDRKRSRSLYKGLTDDEITAFVRIGLQRYFASLDPDFFSEAASSADAAKRGEMDDSEVFKMLRAVLLQLFEVKGVNDA